MASEPIYTDEVPVLRGHLEETHEALLTAQAYHQALDLADAARNVGGPQRPSNISRRLDKAVARVEGYLATQEEDDDVPQG